MSGLIGFLSGYHATMNCDALVILGADFLYRSFYPSDAKIIQIDVAAASQDMVIPPKIKLDQSKGFSLLMHKAIMNGRGGEVLELARTNL